MLNQIGKVLILERNSRKMKKLLLYGAGKRGKRIAKLLMQKGISVVGFLDSYKTNGVVECDDGTRYEIIPYSIIEKDKSDYQVIITIANPEEAIKVKKQLAGVEIINVEDILGGDLYNRVENNRQFIAVFHNTEMEDYYKEAESEDSLEVFWGKNSPFYELFSMLKLDNVIELACGHGRHVEWYKQKAGKITLVDILDKNIQYCKNRFSEDNNISYYVNNGHDLRELESDKYSALFSYDAMVHFEMLDVFDYLKETQRVLQSGGRALFHHSNNTEDYKVTFSTGTIGRNYMSAQLFAHLADRAGLNVIKQQIINWKTAKNLDCITLVEKI